MNQPQNQRNIPKSVTERQKGFTGYHPLLLGVYPFLALLANNLSQVVPILTIRAFIATLVIILLLFFLARKIIPDPMQAALLLSLFFSLFFAYGHVYDLIEGKTVFGFVVGRHMFLAPFWLLIFCGFTWWILHIKADLKPVTKILYTVSVLLISFAIVQLVIFSIRNTPARVEQDAVIPTHPVSINMPDVYYIILDAYTREDMMLKHHNLDISGFVNELQDMGFVFPACTQSNYSITALSLASSLNMNYVEDFAPDIVAQNINWGAFSDFIIHSEVRGLFEEMGYTTVSYETGIAWDELTDAPVYLAREKSPFTQMLNFQHITEFEVLYLRTTALRIIDEVRSSLGYELQTNIQTPEQDHYQRILYVLDKLETTAAIPGPKFVFLHIMAPHGPWVIDEDGKYAFTNDEISGYANEVRYLNNRMPGILQSIIANSELPPVIILQGDHGYLNEERLAILNAYYLPGLPEDTVNPAITPVNTFRLVFNEYLEGNFEFLPNHSYLSDRDIPYDFVEVNYPCP